jgi:hypothetical protein
MADEHDPVHPDVRHEKKDVNVRFILWFAAGMAMSGIVIHFALTWMFGHLKAREEAANPPLPGPIEDLRRQESREMEPRRTGDERRSPREMPPFEGKVHLGYARLNRDGEWEPLLQTDPTRDMEAMHTAEDKYLSSFGWVDEKAGVARIPIDQAMRMLTQSKIAKAHGVQFRPRPKNGNRRGKQR